MPTLHETMFYVKGLEYVVALIFLTGFMAFWQLAIGRGPAEKVKTSESSANATTERAQPLALPGKPGPGLINAPKWDTGGAQRPS